MKLKVIVVVLLVVLANQIDSAVDNQTEIGRIREMIGKRYEAIRIGDSQWHNNTVKINQNYKNNRDHYDSEIKRLNLRQKYLEEHARNMSEKVKVGMNRSIVQVQETIQKLQISVKKQQVWIKNQTEKKTRQYQINIDRLQNQTIKLNQQLDDLKKANLTKQDYQIQSGILGNRKELVVQKKQATVQERNNVVENMKLKSEITTNKALNRIEREKMKLDKLKIQGTQSLNNIQQEKQYNVMIVQAEMRRVGILQGVLRDQTNNLKVQNDMKHGGQKEQLQREIGDLELQIKIIEGQKNQIVMI